MHSGPQTAIGIRATAAGNFTRGGNAVAGDEEVPATAAERSPVGASCALSLRE